MLDALLMTAVLAASAPATVGCDQHVEGDRPGIVPHRTDVKAPGIVFHGLRSWARRPLVRGRHGDHLAKSGVSVRAGAHVTVRIAARDRKRAALDYDRDDPGRRRRARTVARGDGSPAVRFEPCASDHPRFVDGEPMGEWTGFAGGFLVARRACITLVVERPGERPQRRRVGFGRRCGPRR